MELKIGTKVIVRKDLYECDSVIIPFGVNDEMLQFRGKIMTILYVEYNITFNVYAYTMQEDDREWMWNKYMLEGYITDNNKICKFD